MGRGFDGWVASFQAGELEPIAAVADPWAGWCAPEAWHAPGFEQPQEFEGMLRFAKHAADANPQTPISFGARGSSVVLVLPGISVVAPLADIQTAVGQRRPMKQRFQTA